MAETLRNLFLITPTLYDMAIKAETDGTLDALRDGPVAMALGYVGDAAPLFDAHLAEAKAEKAGERVNAACADILKSVTCPKSLATTLGKLMDAHKAEMGDDAPKSLTLTLTLTGENIVVGWSAKSARKARENTGSKGAKSRISAWVAYERGVKAGDPENISKADAKAVYVTPDGKVGRGEGKSLTDYIGENAETYPETANILREYGQLD